MPFEFPNRVDSRENGLFASFAVIHKEFLSKSNRGNTNSTTNFPLGSEIAPCIYPTVKFQITGIPLNFAGDFRGALSTNNPTITLP